MSMVAVSRRRFLALAGAGAAATVLACQQAPATPTSPAAPAAAATAVTVIQTQVVEKVITATPGPAQPTATAQVVQQVVTATPQPQVKGALDAWTFPLTDDDQAYIWKALMGKFKDRYPAIEPKIEVLPWSGRREKMLAAFAAGNPPDVAYVNSDTLSLFGANNVLQDADPLIPASVWSDMPAEIVKSGITWKGKKILVPGEFYGDGYLANPALLKSLGLPEDKKTFTWQEVLDLGGKSKPAGLYATNYNTTNWEQFVQLVWQAGGTVYSDDVTKVLLDQPPAEEALTFVADLFQKGYVPKEGAVGSEQEGSVTAVDYFFTRKQVLSGLSDGTYASNTAKQAPDVKAIVVEPFKNKKQVSLSNSAGWGIFNKSKNTEATAIWVNFIMEPENLGFYCSVSGASPTRNAAQPFWVTDPISRKFTEVTRPFWTTNQDANYFWQEGKTTTAPHFQAAVLGKAPVKQALADATKELQKIVDDFWAKTK
jgi:multiple sugar transport system substrate-binding protein